jgi:DNA-binding NarL/FixJ family response regulator
MIRVLVVADSGDVLSRITGQLCRLERVDIIAYASGRAPVDAIVRATAPDVVMVDEMCWAGLALARVAEVNEAHPGAVVVGLVERPDAGWIVEGLRAGAAAVVPRDLDHETLALVLDEVISRSITLRPFTDEHKEAPMPATHPKAA